MRKTRPNAIPWKTFREKLMSNPEVKKAYEDLQPELAIVQAIIDARVKNKISQEELAKRMGTGQAVISRLENANSSPSLSLIKRLADALGLKVELHFKSR